MKDKKQKRKPATFTIDESVLKRFNEKAEKDCINKSRIVERKIQEYLSNDMNK